MGDGRLYLLKLTELVTPPALLSLVSCGLSCSSDLRAGVAAGLTFPHLSRPNPRQSYKLDNGQHKPANEYSEYNPWAVFQPLSVRQDSFTAHHPNLKMQHHCSTAHSGPAGFYKSNSSQCHPWISETSDFQIALSFHSKKSFPT